MPLYVTHRFLPGLRFDHLWKYRAYAQGGPPRWAHLPLGPDPTDALDPQGAWWCARRCAAVLRRLPWQALPRASPLPYRPGADEVARMLAILLPGWAVTVHGAADASPDAGAGQGPLVPCARALLEGGSALLMLQTQEAGGGQGWMRGGVPPQIYWAWVVGVETQGRLARHRSACPHAASAAAGGASGGAPGGASGAPALAARARAARALLTVPFGWSMPWSGGYTARVQPRADGLCSVDGIAGHWRLSRCLAAIALAPAAPAHALFAPPPAAWDGGPGDAALS